MSGLATVCPCGHAAHYHPTLLMQAEYSRAVAGRYQTECRGGLANGGRLACRCITDRESVIKDGESA